MKSVINTVVPRSVGQRYCFESKNVRIKTISKQYRCFVTQREKREASAAGRELPEHPLQDTRITRPSQRLILPKSTFRNYQLPEIDSFLSEITSRDVISLDQPYHLDLYDPTIHLPSAPTNWKGYEKATPLWKELAALIGVTGKPISTAEYMRMCLTHPKYGYYVKATSRTRNDFEDEDDASEIIGPSGDFITAPEISQVFGECLGVWFMTQWQQQDFQWLELGPGRGTLMIDLLRFCFHEKIKDTFGARCRRVHLIETSPVLRETQKDNLLKGLNSLVRLDFSNDSAMASTFVDSDPRPVIQVTWHNSLSDFRLWQKDNKKLSTFIIGQEFLDALPVYSFQKTEDGWRERLVDIAMREDLLEERERESITKLENKPRLRVVLAPEITPATRTLLRVNDKGLMADESAEDNVGCVIEVSPEAVLHCLDVARIIEDQGGAALFVDYGQEGSTDSIRAFSKHEQVLFLSCPGEVDVTADVDFSALRNAVDALGINTKAYGPLSQGAFLVAMGVSDRVIHLIESDNTTDEHAEDLYNAMIRLASPEDMGERFKVLAISTSEMGPPTGF